ncbi:MAG: hypothetical protein LBH97_05280 [Treponema sp.]|nr:hypothetical protein [Treponema sp.]
MNGFFLRLSFLVLVVLFLSCGVQPRAVLFPVRGTNAALSGLSREASAGTLDFSAGLKSKAKKLEYRFESAHLISSAASLEIEYVFNVPPALEIKEHYQLILEAGEHSWVLPMDFSFLGIDHAGGVFHYAIPIVDSIPRQFSIMLAPLEPKAKRIRLTNIEFPVFQIRSLAITERWFGFYSIPGNNDASGAGPEHFFATPFVYMRENELIIDPPPRFSAGDSVQQPLLSLELSAGRDAAVAAGNMRFEALQYLQRLNVPAGIIPPGAGPFAASGDRIAAFRLSYAAPLPFPAPISADPGMILAWPAERWRDRRYELFRWEQFPSLLIFDFADYNVQDRFLKRLAFFTEKAGFRGRLAHDAEIADLHGWNAHDYRAADLARFFETVRSADFPLLAEERELEQILLNAGIIRRSNSGSIHSGEGGIISVSRESPDYLRARFMVHESFHGIFFIDEDFRAFTQNRWAHLDAQAKRFIVSYFDYQRYDIQDEYLVVNEFMAHILQQSVLQAGGYFGQQLPAIIESSPWRRTVLPEKDIASSSWPSLASAFTREAEAFSAYVNQRWGLAAGRVRLVTVRLP